jgi:hypothetical protein
MAGGNREGIIYNPTDIVQGLHMHADRLPSLGGKAKPLKAPKKEKKELDEDDLAHKEKMKAGMSLSVSLLSHSC